MCKWSGPSTTCAAQTLSKGLDDTAKQEIVNKHNELRRQVAKGYENRGSPGPQPAASDMLLMVWDDELATIAQRWADQCTFGHDNERSISEGSVGQNTYITYNSAEMSDSAILASYNTATTYWYEEVNDPGFNNARVDSYQFNYGNSHYTQVVWAESRRLGCGSVHYNDGSSYPYSQLIVCNYFPAGNFHGAKMYSTGTACVACPTEYPNCSNGLCTA
jgi:hypothetical protein